MSNSKIFQTVDNLNRKWILYRNKAVGAIVVTSIRTYTYPFFTPDGIIVIQECPPDHLHHQGIMLGQTFVNGHNFWAMNQAGYPLNRQIVECTEEHIDEKGVTIIQGIQWVTSNGQYVLNEERVTRFEVWDSYNFVGVKSTWKALYGDVYIAKTKEGGLGIRVQHQLERFWGGRVRSAEGAVGEENVFDSFSDWLEIQGKVQGKQVGIVMMPHPSQPKIPWFTRDYGLHLYAPYRHASVHLRAGDNVSLQVGFAAFDGQSDGSRAEKAWKLYCSR